jgi:alkanesulfonate monooxygenase
MPARLICLLTRFTSQHESTADPRQCADVLQGYIDIGCRSFCLAGYLHDEETWRFKKWVRPILADRNKGRMAA